MILNIQIIYLEDKRTGANIGLKLLPALNYRRIISTSNEHSTNRANSFPNFGNSSSPQNVSAKCEKTNQNKSSTSLEIYDPMEILGNRIRTFDKTRNPK